MQNSQTKINQKTIEVAVAVIHYNDQYLLGYRLAHQHQGEKYEFVGGKLDTDETAEQALIREVAEEIGMDISTDCEHNKLGEIHHDYPDKKVCLLVYQVSIANSIYQAFKDKQQGTLGQPICWVNKTDLLANKYPLPEANQQILDWLTL